MKDLNKNSRVAVKGQDYDVAVIGGGPAGAAGARALARRGRRVLLVERQRFPRFHVGESLLPATNAVFDRLGLGDLVDGAGFVEKRGASFTTEDGERSSYVDFTTTPGVATPLTYQVLRSRFDELLLAQAAAAGVEVRQGWHAREVAFEPGRATLGLEGATAANGRPTRQTVSAAIVLDASGQAGFLAKRLGLRRADSRLRKVAVYAHLEGVARPEGERSGDIRIISRQDLGWIWLIPISATVTSVGIVVGHEQHKARGEESPEQTFDRLIAETPIAAAQLEGARRISPVRFEADFSYDTRSYAGDRWLLAGDAGAFLDPVFSTGVMVALESGLDAAEAIDRALARRRVSRRAFAGFERRQRRRFHYFRRFVTGFYDPAFRDLFFQPAPRFGLKDAVSAALAGNWQPSPMARLRLAIFFAAVAAQRFLPLAPRSHGSRTASR